MFERRTYPVVAPEAGDSKYYSASGIENFRDRVRNYPTILRNTNVYFVSCLAPSGQYFRTFLSSNLSLLHVFARTPGDISRDASPIVFPWEQTIRMARQLLMRAESGWEFATRSKEKIWIGNRKREVGQAGCNVVGSTRQRGGAVIYKRPLREARRPARAATAARCGFST